MLTGYLWLCQHLRPEQRYEAAAGVLVEHKERGRGMIMEVSEAVKMAEELLSASASRSCSASHAVC